MASDLISTASTASAIARLVKPRSVAVIGASADPAKTSGRPVSYLTRNGFGGGSASTSRLATLKAM